MPSVPQIPNDGQVRTIALTNQHGGDDWQYDYEKEPRPKRAIAVPPPKRVRKPKEPKREVVGTHCSWCGARYRYGIHPKCEAARKSVQAWRERKRSADLA